MNSGSCPGCLSDVSIRIILWGMPSEEPDPAIYITGGCCIEEEMPEMECIKCGWQGSKVEVEKATRMRRFIWTDEDMPGIIFHKKFRITHEVLADLKRSQAWQNATSFNSQFTPESIYGPEGKLQWLWSLSWDSQEAMKNDLCANMGGGVPIEIIDELVRIVLTRTSI